MKSKIILGLALTLMLLCACGEKSMDAQTAPTASKQETTQSAAETAAVDGEQPAPDGAPSALTAQEAKTLAQGCIGKPVETLYDAIGTPKSADYAPSCLGEGDDGNLSYDGFTVYTYREGESETVSYVE